MTDTAEPTEVARPKDAAHLEARRWAVIAIGLAMIGIGFLSMLTHGIGNPFFSIGSAALGVPLAAEVMRSRSPDLKRLVCLLIPLSAGLTIGIKGPSRFAGDLSTFFILLSDTWPLFLLVAVAFLPFRRTRLAANLLAAGTLLFTLPILIGFGVSHGRQTKGHDDRRVPGESAGGPAGHA